MYLIGIKPFLTILSILSGFTAPGRNQTKEWLIEGNYAAKRYMY